MFPAGAVDAETTFRIAIDSTGAPPLPSTLVTVGNMYVITPHGGNFPQPVEVSFPAPNVTLNPNQQLKLAKAQPDGVWEILSDSYVVDGKLKSTVTSFSFFTSVIVTYVLPIAQAPPFQLITSVDCGEQDCQTLIGPATVTYHLTGNGGQLPADCVNPHVWLTARDWEYPDNHNISYHQLPASGFTLVQTLSPRVAGFQFSAFADCPGLLVAASHIPIAWSGGTAYPAVSIASAPDQLDVVEGMAANLDVIVFGGAVRGIHSPTNRVPTATDRAIIDWQRSDNGGASWREIARSFQNEGNSRPFLTGWAWHPWSVRHVFIATAADQGALIRAHVCYAPPAPTAAPPCDTGPATRINVLQQSALPAIHTQPRSVLIRTGETADFSVTVSGAPTPVLQWQTRAANSNGEWTNVDVGTGATTVQYTTAPRAPSHNGEQYRVLATNAVGSAASAPVTLSVSDLHVAPSITTQPASLSVASGSDAILAVDAYGTEALSYQWSLNGTDITGANSPVLRLVGVSGSNAGAYAVRVSNAAGNTVSDNAVLTVTAGTPAAVAPSIVTQPSAVTVNAGNTATLAVGVAGTGPFSFQWRRDGVNVNGATSAVLTFNSVALPNAGSYSVRVTNSAGEVVSNAVMLDVIAAASPVAPTITTQPATLIVPLNGSGTLAVGAAGSGPISYQWYLDGNSLPGATQPVLNFTQLGSVDFGQYTVAVSNGVGSVTSQPASLIMLGAPVINQQPADTTVLEGGSATFFVQASGSGLRYQWLMNGTPIPGAIAATFNTSPLVAANSGAVYGVLVYNGAGHVYSQGAVLTVTAVVAPSIVSHPAGSTIQPGAQAEMCVTIGGTPTFDVQLQRWNGSSWSGGPNMLLNQNTNACYFTDPLTLGESGAQFRFFVQNAAGQVVSNTATVTVQAPPVGITQTTLVSRANSGAIADNRSHTPSLSADGNLVAFVSDGTNLVPGFTNPGHGYVRNLTTGVTTVVNQTVAGTQSTHGVIDMKLAAGGRYVVFTSLAGDLVPGDTNGSQDVFVRDLLTHTTERVNVLPDGSGLPGSGNGISDARLDISADGVFVIFASFFDVTTNGAALPRYSLFLRDVQSDQTRIVAAHPTYDIQHAAISANGEHVAYSLAIPAPTSATIEVYDAGANTSGTLFTLDASSGVDYLAQGLSISANGRHVAFALRSPSLLGTTVPQIAVIDRLDPMTVIFASLGSQGSGIGFGDGGSRYPRLSGDGRHVLFATNAANISGGAGNGLREVLVVRDLQAQSTTVASRRADDTPVPLDGDPARGMALSGDGNLVGFTADEFEMSGGFAGRQVYASPRP